MKIGYACLVMGVNKVDFKSCQLKNLNNERLITIIKHNLEVLERIIDYNIENDIKLFRITSDLIPFGSSPVNKINWWDQFQKEFFLIGEKIKTSKMRVSMHPGQYTIINSLSQEVVYRAIDDLKYHARVLESLGLDNKHKIILHLGGVYNDKKEAMKRFINNFYLIDEKIRKRIVIENDDKLYNINEVLEIGLTLNIPVVFDTLHHEVLPSNDEKKLKEWIDECRKTWKKEDGIPKIHYSQQDREKKPGAHSKTIDLKTFLTFVSKIDDDIDIMLEVKDKNLSTIKCLNGLNHYPERLKKEWNKYKYKVLECDALIYEKINLLLSNDDQYPVVEFYHLIDEALAKPIDINNAITSAFLLWSNLENIVTDKEKKRLLKNVDDVKSGKISINRFKKFIWILTNKYNCQEIIKSYYFYL